MAHGTCLVNGPSLQFSSGRWLLWLSTRLAIPSSHYRRWSPRLQAIWTFISQVRKPVPSIVPGHSMCPDPMWHKLQSSLITQFNLLTFIILAKHPPCYACLSLKRQREVAISHYIHLQTWHAIKNTIKNLDDIYGFLHLHWWCSFLFFLFNLIWTISRFQMLWSRVKSHPLILMSNFRLQNQDAL